MWSKRIFRNKRTPFFRRIRLEASSQKYDEIKIQYQFHILKVEGLAENKNGKEFIIKWKCYDKKPIRGATLSEVASERAINWNHESADNSALFAIMMNLNTKTQT